jgi:UDP-GlcNAc:undecaprenyl-phosphate GlcNAc-1-phosphate transferase
MPEEIRILGVLTTSGVFALLATPIAIRIAGRLRFYDVPLGYKGHRSPTPYLGGAATLAAILAGALAFGGAYRSAAVVGGAVLLWVVGTVDDRRNLSPLTRIAFEGVAAIALWASGLGWSIFPSEPANLALTIIWIVGIVNAFNLMDNMDGAAPSVAGVCGVAIGVLALLGDDFVIAGFAFAVSGACVAFLRYNLATPAQIFLGDGGSMPIGFILGACALVVAETHGSGWTALNAAIVLVGLPVFDTCLVVVSRRRRGVAVLTGARDHLTHRLLPILGSVRGVVLFLVGCQALLCTSAVAAVLGEGAVDVVPAALTVALAAMTAASLRLPTATPAADVSQSR